MQAFLDGKSDCFFYFLKTQKLKNRIKNTFFLVFMLFFVTGFAGWSEKTLFLAFFDVFWTLFLKTRKFFYTILKKSSFLVTPMGIPVSFLNKK